MEKKVLNFGHLASLFHMCPLKTAKLKFLIQLSQEKYLFSVIVNERKYEQTKMQVIEL